MRARDMCCFAGVLVGLALTGALLGIFVVKKATTELTELRQVHAVFGNGERTPDGGEADAFPLDPHRSEAYEPHGLGALTNEGKTTAFRVGERLRREYGQLLGETYRQGESEALAADTDAAKMGALLLLAGLWPVDERDRWIDVAWQPVPYSSLPFGKDYMLYEDNCPEYVREKERVTQLLAESAPPSHRELYLGLSELTGRNISSPSLVSKLTNLIAIQKRMKMSSPEWWGRLKYALRDMVRLEYDIMFHNTLLRRLSAGKLLDNILSTAKERANGAKVKLYAYSTTLNNVAALASVLEDSVRYPRRYGETLVFELHYRPFLDDYAFKIAIWEDNVSSGSVVLPQCDELCPLAHFEDRLRDVLRVDYERECNFT